MNRNSMALISVGQAANNVADAICSLDKRFIPLFVNTSLKDIEVLDNITENNVFLFPMMDGAGANRNKSKEMTFSHLPNLIDVISNAFVTQDTLYLMTSCAGGSGSGLTPRLIQLLKHSMPEKNINLIAILPAIDESKRRRNNFIEFWDELIKVRKNLNAVMLIDNNARNCENNDYEKINNEFANLFNYTFNMCESNTKGNIDLADSEEIHNAKGISAIYTLPKNPRNFKNINDTVEFAISKGIFSDIKGCKEVSHLAISLRENTEYNFKDIENYFTVEVDKYKGYNSLNKDIVMISGLPFNSAMETVDKIQNSVKQQEENKKTSLEEESDDELLLNSSQTKTNSLKKKSLKKKKGGYTVNEIFENDDLWDNLV